MEVVIVQVVQDKLEEVLPPSSVGLTEICAIPKQDPRPQHPASHRRAHQS